MTREEIYSRFEELDKNASLGGGVDKIEKQHAQGKMTARERIEPISAWRRNRLPATGW